VKYLLDTNVVSEVRRAKCQPNVRARLAAIPEEDLCISVITIGEIAHGICRLEPGKRRREFEEWLGQTERFFADRLLPVDREIARLWGEITAKAAEQGRAIHAADGLIAATAVRHGLHLMTRDVMGFEATGVMLINPWEEVS
jgi:toxin FitB